MNKLRMGVVGVGYLGRYHAEKYAGMDDATLAGVADVDAARAEAVAKKLHTRAYARYQDLFGKVDAVSVAVPTSDHFTVSRDFLMQDVDVLIEKPITTTLAEADELIDLAESRGLIIQVGHLERFNPAVIAVREYLTQPMFIESHRLSVFKNRCTDVSVVLDLMIHDIDIIRNLVGTEIKTIHAAGTPVISREADIANARLEFDNGCVANVTASRISMKNERKIRLFQREAYLSVDFANREIAVIRQCADPAGPQNPGPIPGVDVNRMCFTESDALKDELAAFVRSVRRREACEVSGQVGRDALKIALSVMEQIAEKARALGVGIR